MADRHLACAGGRRGREPHDLAADGVATRPAPAASSPGREPLSSRHPCATVTSATASTTGASWPESPRLIELQIMPWRFSAAPQGRKRIVRLGARPERRGRDSLASTSLVETYSRRGAGPRSRSPRFRRRSGSSNHASSSPATHAIEPIPIGAIARRGLPLREWNPHRRTAESRLVHPSCHWVRGCDDAPRHRSPGAQRARRSCCRPWSDETERGVPER